MIEHYTVDIGSLINTLAFQEITGSAVRVGHNSRLSRVEADGWHAAEIRKAQGVVVANDIASFKKAMSNHGAAVVFLTHSAIIDDRTIESICMRSGLDKMIVWEAA